jgi:hypothetical protein
VSTLERAIEIAVQADAGIGDKAGEPYIFHPLRVMLRLSDEDTNCRVCRAFGFVSVSSPRRRLAGRLLRTRSFGGSDHA